MSRKNLIPAVKSIAELCQKAANNKDYMQLAYSAARNLGMAHVDDPIPDAAMLIRCLKTGGMRRLGKHANLNR
jgi:hypothetical protein